MSDTPHTSPPEEPHQGPVDPGEHAEGTRPVGSFDTAQAKVAVRQAHNYDLGIVVVGLLAFIFSLFSYYTVSVSGPVSAFSALGSESAWHGFFGWFAALVALAASVLLALRVLGIRLLDGATTRMAVLVGYAVSTVCVLLALLIWPGKVDCGGNSTCEDAFNYGHGIGYWLSLIVILVGLALSYLRKDARD